MEMSGEPMRHEKPNIKGDKVNIMLIILMYTHQGIISGFIQAFPIIFQNKQVSFADQAEFSFADYPNCFKLIWAPIVDCVFSRRIGRRKTWVIPTQYMMGLTLLYVSIHLNDWLGGEDGTQKPRIRTLTVLLFCCQFFSAIQDVALDGWALTMMQRRNVGYAGLCQSSGTTIGTFVTYVGFIILDSKDFCNLFRTVPKEHGFVTLSEFIFFWSMMFVISTTLIFIFKKDNSLEVIEDEDCECKLGLKGSYEYLWNIVKLRPMLTLCFILLTFYVGFGPVMSVSQLKIIDVGISKENFVLFTIPALPIQIILSVFLRGVLTGPRLTHSVFVNYLLLLTIGVLLAWVLYLSPYVRNLDNVLPSWYYGVLFFLYNARSVLKNLMVLSICTFFCRISDPRYGGIYLTLMNNVINIGIRWPQTLSLWCVDPLTIQTCDNDEALAVKNCWKKLDGYYTETALFTAIALLWSCWGRRQVCKLQNLKSSAWLIERKDTLEGEEEPALGQTISARNDISPSEVGIVLTGNVQ